ncbi:mitochondrial ribonuclease P catalytic subunit [Gadus morhua]|uniref:mitochondrial ribonuclease P catalytic subunit n=1 Tax=Gadus morhua TaxID=8049 RepID=UPI0011B69112|nr:mitochondrial ribonuclease P catalytic subunit [Gadus morhua]
MGATFLFQARLCLYGLSQSSGIIHLGKMCVRTMCTKGIKPGERKSPPRKNDTTIRQTESFKVRQMPSFPTSVFAAGNAKRTTEMLKRKTALASLEQEDAAGDQPRRRGFKTDGLVAPDRPLSPTEWKKQLEEAPCSPERFDVHMMTLLFKTGAELDIAKSLLTFVALETGTMSYQLLLQYLTLCVKGGHDAEALDCYQIMRGAFPALETGASSLFIKAFSRTESWREALPILRDMKKVIAPSTRNYSDIISGALLHGAAAPAWQLYDEVLGEGLTPLPDTWRALFEGGARGGRAEEEGGISPAEYGERLLGVLGYMRDNQVYPERNLADAIKTWFHSLPGHHWRGEWTTVSPKGVCKGCGSELESIQLTPEEYTHLEARVMADIIQGKDVFQKTTAEELESFKAFVKRKPVFDVVVDGLNVANIVKGRQSEMLLAVVCELERQGLTSLVLGRKHMLRPSASWDRRNMGLIQKKAHCFFTENTSEDDPFLLYATLHSGNHCRFLSRDLMRDHKACLPDALTRRLFFKWQRGHQLVIHGTVAQGRRVGFQMISPYDTIVQSTGVSWHVPYDDSVDRSSYEVPQSWLCLTNKP